MDLDEPLREDERLPVAQHRMASIDLGKSSPTKEGKKHKKSKTVKEEKPKKSKKSKKETAAESPVPAPEPEPEPAVAPKAAPQNDMDFWLSASGTSAKTEEPAPSEEKVSKKVMWIN